MNATVPPAHSLWSSSKIEAMQTEASDEPLRTTRVLDIITVVLLSVTGF